MKRTAIIYFKRYKLSDLSLTCSIIIKSLTDNSNFPDLPVSLAVLSTSLSDFRKAITAAANGDRLAIAKRNTIRDTLMQQLGSIGKYVNMISTSEAMLITSGYPLSEIKQPIKLTGVNNMKLIAAPGTATLTSKAPAVKGAKAYVHYISTDQNLPLEAWTQVSTSTCKQVFTDLKRGTLYYAKSGYCGHKKAGLLQ